MDGDIQYIHTTCMHAWFHVAKDCAVQLAEGEGDDSNDNKNSIAPSRTIEHQPATSTKENTQRART